jgi:riboflavin synthase
MFTGIIETIGKVIAKEKKGSNISFTVASSISNELKIDQSISHNGVCLTVEQVHENHHTVTAIEETLRKTNLQYWEVGTIVNIERCLQMNGRLDGHIVQGHVDATATCKAVTTLNGSWEYEFVFDNAFANLVIEKGSITVNGTSLTCFNVTNNSFTVAIIPYTYNHTNIQQVVAGSIVNIEFDIIGKYIHRIQELKR